MQEQQLSRGLKNRHVQLIAIGGAIGTGLFLGAGKSIHLAGPSILFAYLITGIICFLIMRALGELLLTNLKYNSFVDFVQDYLGNMAAFITGWTYWFCWISIAMADLTAVGLYTQFWFPECTTVDARINCTCHFAIYEPCNCKTFWRNGILVRIN